MKIGVKLSIAFSLVIFFLLVIAFISLNSLSSLNDDMSKIKEDRMPKVEQANRVLNQLNTAARSIRNIILLNPNQIEKINYEKVRLEKTSEIITKTLDTLNNTIKSERGKEILNSIAEHRKIYLQDRTKLLDLYFAGKKDEAVEFLLNDLRKSQQAYMDDYNVLISYQTELTYKSIDEAHETYQTLKTVIIGLAIFALAFAILMAFLITKGITKSLSKAVAAADSIAKGNINVDLDTKAKDETGILLNSMKEMVSTLKKLTGELNRLSRAAVDGKLDTRADIKQFQGEFQNITIGFNDTLDAVIGPLNVTAEYVDRISKGDIPPRITDNYNGDFNEIKNNLNQCIDAVELLVKDANMLSQAAIQGKLDTRADANKHLGDFRAIVQGVNSTLDSVIGPLNVAAEYVDRISKGDVPPKITDNYNGDFNEIKNNLNQCIDAVNLLVTDAKMLAKAAVDGKLDTRADAMKHQGDFRAIVKGVNDTLDSVIGPLNVAAEYVDRIAKGDIPPKITDNYNGDFNEIKNNLNQCIDAVNLLVSDANLLSNAAIEGKLSTRADATRHQGDFRKIVQGVNETLDSVINPMMVAADFIAKVSRGDDLEDITKEYKGDFNIIKNNINQTKKILYGLIGEVQNLVSAAVEGKLDTRANSELYNGGWNTIISGFNQVLDSVIMPLNVAAEYVDRISKGDIPPKITDNYNGDFNEIKNNLNQCIDAVELLVTDANMLANAAIEGRLQTRAEASRHQGDFRKIVEGVNHTLDAVIEPINEAGEVLGVLATGDLTIRMHGEYNGDLAKLKSDINTLAESLDNLISEVFDAVHTAASSAVEISATAESLAAASQEQSAQADEVASAVEQMSRTVTENAMSANKTAEVAQLNGQAATEGGAVVSQTVSKMRDIASVVKNSADNIQKLGESSKQIGEIISVIDDIADQTNLLALNAAIEAARAGEQGRGFAVVADEVRKLAERTTEATKQIASMIKGIQSETEGAVVAMNRGNEEVKSGIELADKAGASLQQILASTQEVLDMINQIAAASEEQSATSEQISKNVVSISKVTSDSAHRVEDVAHTSDELAKMTEQLIQLMNKFKVNSDKEKNDHKLGSRNKHLLNPYR